MSLTHRGGSGTLVVIVCGGRGSSGVDAMAVLLSSRDWVDVRAYHGYSPGSWNLTRTHTRRCGYGSDRRMSEGYPQVLVARLGVVGVVGVFEASGSHQAHG